MLGSYAAVPPAIDLDHERMFKQKFRQVEAARVQREKQQGLGRGIVSATLHDHRIVAVGNTVYTSKEWKTFHDFAPFSNRTARSRLVQDGALKGNISERLPIVRWYDQAMDDTRRLCKKVGEVYVGPMTGAQRAFINLAYNIYLIAHHANPSESAALVASFTQRLKSERTDAFVGKLFETYAAATFLKAGFQIAYENETDGNTSTSNLLRPFPPRKNSSRLR